MKRIGKLPLKFYKVFVAFFFQEIMSDIAFTLIQHAGYCTRKMTISVCNYSYP